MNQRLLEGIITKRGMTAQELARKIGEKPEEFQRKLEQNGDAEFTLGEIQALRNLLKLDSSLVEAIFFTD